MRPSQWHNETIAVLSLVPLYRYCHAQPWIVVCFLHVGRSVCVLVHMAGLYCPVKVCCLCFGGAYCVHLQGDSVWFRWVHLAVNFPEISEQTFSTRCKSPVRKTKCSHPTLCHSLNMSSDDPCHHQSCLVYRT